MMIFTKDDQYYVLKTSQSVPEEIAKVFNFFENPSNLNLITPSWLNFTLLPPVPCTTFENQEIEYKLTLHNIRFKWTSRIIDYQKNISFCDKQIKGPYAFWEHQHLFEKIGSQTLVTDIVKYKILPGVLSPILGSFTNMLFVERDLKKIFGYRQEKIRELFS
ncbi:MAG: SRPBCC family protein [Chloroflexota bacterium]|nr:SRPBCC family protein [Chloroflexota bacterium]|tara:strand:- start:23808 stop:24293 length:486 start_codon:yes stop_codon:yes gene_type:complete